MLLAAYKHLFISITLLALMLMASAYAEDHRGKVLKTGGQVHIVDRRGERRTVDESGLIVREMDTIVTAVGGHAIVRFTDGTLSVLDENSSLQVEKANWLSHLSGKIYFTFKKAFGERRQVKTRFATLGIRGTTFIVYDDDMGQGVALEEGLLEIESLGPLFEIHKQQELDEFEAFQRQALEQQQNTRNEFENYKNQAQIAFIEYQRSFTLRPNRVIQIDGIRVDEHDIDDRMKAEFENFEKLAGKLLEAFREQTSQHREQVETESTR